MRRADRLIELTTHLRQDRPVTAHKLATLLETSVRTVYRDIAALQAQGLRIEGSAGFGYALRAPVNLPPLTFDHDQLEALALGLAYVTQVGDTALAAAARAARAKIDVVWDQKVGGVSVRRLRSQQRPERRAPKFTQKVREALRERRVLEFAYEDAQGKASVRKVQPVALTAFSAGWLLIAWCLVREDFRLFRLDRIGKLVMLEETFEEETGRDLAAYLEVRGASVAGRQPGSA
jgi:predicted DNA-binding transcriptional regulator YafY